MAKRMRGAIPSPRHKLAAAKPHVIVGATPPYCLYNPTELSTWGNTQYGDCVTAEEAFAKACHAGEIFLPDSVVIGWAQTHNVLSSAVISDVLETMVSDGFTQNGSVYDDGQSSAVDWTNAPILQNAIAQGPVKLGVAANQLDSLNTTQSGWFATGFTSDSIEDHCVSLCGFGPLSWLAGQLSVQLPDGVNGDAPGYAMFTWGTIGIIDEPSMQAITHEAWLRSPTTVVTP